MPFVTLANGDPLQILTFSLDDVPAIHCIEAEASEYPWSDKNFIDAVESGQLCLGAKLLDKWVGVLVVQDKTQDAEVHILAVHPDAQRRGIAHALLSWVIESELPKADRLFLEVRASNHAAINLYENLGFNCLGERPNYYPARNNRREDALILGLELFSKGLV